MPYQSEKTRLLDSVSTIQTPEGVEIHFKLAGVWPRSVAWLLDAVIRAVLYILLGMLSSALGDFGAGLMLIVFFFIEWFYPVLFEVFNQGMTPGKRYLNIQVINSDGTPIGWSSSMLRNILRTVDFLPFFYGFGFISMLMNDRFQRLGDLAADTMVAYNTNATLLHAIPEFSAIKPACALNLKEQQAIIRYAERSEQFSDERLQELAEILNPLEIPGDSPRNSHGVSPDPKMTKDKLLGIANGLIGRQ